jgi:hypothetical protein
VLRQAWCIVRKLCEHSLSDILRGGHIAIHLAKRRRINQIDVLPDQFLKSRLGSVIHIALEQFVNVHIYKYPATI